MVFIYGIKKKESLKLDDIIINGIKENLLADGANNKLVNKL